MSLVVYAFQPYFFDAFGNALQPMVDNFFTRLLFNGFYLLIEEGCLIQDIVHSSLKFFLFFFGLDGAFIHFIDYNTKDDNIENNLIEKLYALFYGFFIVYMIIL